MTNSLRTNSLKERQREERAALILHSAYDVLIEKGYYEASMDEIAARVGISKGTLYLHFKSKEDLVFMLIEQELGKFLALIDHIQQQKTSIRSRLEQILLETYKSIQSGRHLLFALRSIGLNSGHIRERITGMTGLVNRLTMLFEEGKENRELDPAVPTPIMVSVFLELMGIYSEQTEINQLTPEDLLQSVSQIFFDGLSAKS